MTIQQTERQLRSSDASETSREVAQKRIPLPPATDMLTELRAMRMLLERGFKPPTVQYVSVFHGTITLPTVASGGPPVLLLDHDDDRAGFIILNDATSNNIARVRPDDQKMATNQDGFPIAIGQAFTVGQQGVCPSNRIYGFCDAGVVAVWIWVTRVDRFPRSTR